MIPVLIIFVNSNQITIIKTGNFVIFEKNLLMHYAKRGFKLPLPFESKRGFVLRKFSHSLIFKFSQNSFHSW